MRSSKRLLCSCTHSGLYDAIARTTRDVWLVDTRYILRNPYSLTKHCSRNRRCQNGEKSFLVICVRSYSLGLQSSGAPLGCRGLQSIAQLFVHNGLAQHGHILKAHLDILSAISGDEEEWDLLGGK